MMKNMVSLRLYRWLFLMSVLVLPMDEFLSASRRGSVSLMVLAHKIRGISIHHRLANDLENRVLQDEKQDKEEEDSKKQNDEEDNDVEDVPPMIVPTFSPSANPPTVPPADVVSPTDPPTEPPTEQQQTIPPTSFPTFETSQPTALPETALPEIVIDIMTTSTEDEIVVTNTCDGYLEEFVKGLLSSSRTIPDSELNATILDVSFVLPKTTESDGTSSSTSAAAVPGTTTSTSSSSPSYAPFDPAPVQILIEGKIRQSPSSTDSEDLHNKMSYGLVVYLTLWGTGSLEDNLEKCGFVRPTVTAMYVDGTSIKMPEVTVDTNESNEATAMESAASVHRPLYHNKLIISTMLFWVSFFLLELQ